MADALHVAPTAPARANLRMAAQAILDAWNAEANRETDIIGALEGPMTALRMALAGRMARTGSTESRPPPTGTKQERVLPLLRRDEGATIAQIAATTGWQSHTVRGFLVGLKKQGIAVAALDQIRQVGPNQRRARAMIVRHGPSITSRWPK